MPPFAMVAVLKHCPFHLRCYFDSLFAEIRLIAFCSLLRAPFLASSLRFFDFFSDEFRPGRFSDFGSCLEHSPDPFDG